MEEQVFGGLRYVVRYPEGFDPAVRYPAVIFLHGAGTIGNDIQKVTGNPFWGHVERVSMPAVYFAPQCDEGHVWLDRMERLCNFANMVAACPFVDAARVYLTGNSMGGYGSWQLAMSLPDTFAAVVPVCGGGMYWNAGKLKTTPIWAFHGQLDRVVFCEESQKMVNAVNAKGGSAKLTLFPEAQHNSWDPTYSDPEMWRWMFSHRRADKQENTAQESFDGKTFG